MWCASSGDYVIRDRGAIQEAIDPGPVERHEASHSGYSSATRRPQPGQINWSRCPLNPHGVEPNGFLDVAQLLPDAPRSVLQHDLIIAPDTSVSFVVVGAGGFVGLGKHDVAIPVNQLK